MKKTIGKKAPTKASKGKAKTTTSSNSATTPARRIPTKRSPPEETEDVPVPTETAVAMSSHIAEALQKLGSGDRLGNKKQGWVLVEDEERKQKRKNKKNSLYRSLISHLVSVHARS